MDEAEARVADFYLEEGIFLGALGEADSDGGVFGICLESIEHNFGESVAEGLVIAGDFPGGEIFIEAELGEFFT